MHLPPAALHRRAPRRRRTADVEHPRGYTALWLCSQQPNVAAARLLIGAGADVNHTPPRRGCVLYQAAMRGHVELTRLLLAHPAAELECRHPDTGATPLIIAAMQDHVGCVVTLLDARANIDAVDNDGATALYIASHERREGAVRLLLERGASVSKGSYYDEGIGGPLEAAASQGHVAIVRTLLDACADARTTIAGFRAVDFAREAGHEQVARMLARDARLRAERVAADETGESLGTAERAELPEAVVAELRRRRDVALSLAA